MFVVCLFQGLFVFCCFFCVWLLFCCLLYFEYNNHRSVVLVPFLVFVVAFGTISKVFEVVSGFRLFQGLWVCFKLFYLVDTFLFQGCVVCFVILVFQGFFFCLFFETFRNQWHVDKVQW